jgi:hypothetical protein
LLRIFPVDALRKYAYNSFINNGVTDMTNTHIATITAFANKFGTYSAVIRDERTKERKVERFASFDEARNFCRTYAWKTFGPGKYANIARKGEYLANYWIAA